MCSLMQIRSRDQFLCEINTKAARLPAKLKREYDSCKAPPQVLFSPQNKSRW